MQRTHILARGSVARIALPVLLAAVASCRSSGDDTAIVIHVISDEALTLDAVDMMARLAGSGDGGEAVKSAHFPNPASVSWVLTPSGADKMFSIEIVANGMRANASGAVVSQRAIVAFVAGRRIEITMSLTQACVGFSCSAALTCDHGSCLDPSVVGRQGLDGGLDAPDAAPNTDGAQDRGADAGDGRREAAPNVNRPIGDPCTVDGDCASTHCVDGVCCDDVCGGSCQQCDTSAMRGHCVAIAAGQPAPTKRPACAMDDVSTCKQTGVCDGKGACQLHPDGAMCKAATCDATANTITESRCDGMGMCKAGTPLSCAPFRCKAGDTQCARTCSTNTDCDGQPCLANSCGKLKVAAACNTDAECELGFCVDKVCCDVRCGGQCQACNLSSSVGTCSSVRSGQPVGGRALCTGTGTCGGSCMGQSGCTYPPTSLDCRSASCDVSTLTAPAKCDGAGACPAVSNSPCPRSLRCQPGSAICLATCTATADCIPGFYCVSGTCTGTKANGMTCQMGVECSSGMCTDGHCCNMACGGSCQTCATGTCGMVTSADDADTCTGANTCNAVGACAKKQGQTCAGNTECASGLCVDGHCCNMMCNGSCQTCSTGTCGTVTNADDDTCTGNQTCSAAGACAKKPGQTCTLNTECANQMCVDGRCCPTACGGSCQTCSSGTCGMVTNADDADTCTGNNTCNAAGTCTKKLGQTCAGGTECASGLCVDGHCCNNACTGTCQTCATGTCSTVTNADDNTCTGTTTCNATGACVNKQGQVCTMGSQCANNICIDGRCCNVACTGPCLTCATGTCAAVMSADDADTCTNTMTCNAAGTCTKKQGQTCTLGTECASGQCVDGHCCNSACTGTCQTCATGTCATVTNADDNTCTNTMTCNATGTCTKKQGQTCTLGTECASALCVDGHCCNSTCTGTCQTCSTGTCSTVMNADDNTCTNTMTCNATGGCAKKTGQTCGTNAECASAFCVDGRCCGSACNGACQMCNAAGSCVALMNVEDPPGNCSNLRYCDGSGVCQNRITEFTVPTANSRPYDIVAGPDGNLWFSESGSTKLGRITTAGAITEFSTANVSAQSPTALAAEPASTATKRVWFITQDMLGAMAAGAPTPTATLFTSPGAGTFFHDVVYLPSTGRVDMTDNQSGFSEFIPQPPPGYNSLGNFTTATNQATIGPDGNVWFTGSQGLQMILSVNDPALGITEFPINVVDGVQTIDVATGPDGNLWFIRPDPNQLNTFLEIADRNGNFVNNTNIAPGQILRAAKLVRGPGNTMYFTDGIGSVSRADGTTLAIRTFVTPTMSSGAAGITVGPDGNIWFTELTANRIGRLVPP